MAARRLRDTTVRLRRGHRRDLTRVWALLGDDVAPRRRRFDRRVLADLGGDVYVAEDAAGDIVGVVAVGYLRSLVAGSFAAVLDTARTREQTASPLLEDLVAFAEDRARRRGCRRIRAWPAPDDAALRAVLAGRGYRAGDCLSAELEQEG